MKVYIMMIEDWGVMQSITSYSTEAKAKKALKAEMRKSFKECSMTTAEKKMVREQVEKELAYDIDFDEHTQHAYIVESEVQ